MKINVYVANESHTVYAEEICNLVYISAQERGTGIAKRSPEYIKEKMIDGKAVIAIAEDGTFAGFSYIETWSHTKFVANSGLIVAHQFRKTGLAVMKINSDLGYKPVPFSELTSDMEFWNGCQGCRNFDILVRNDYKMCLCTALLYDPANEKHKSSLATKVGKGIALPFKTIGKTLLPSVKKNKKR